LFLTGDVARGDRRALLLYVVGDMSYSEIAATLGVSVGAVKSRIFRAREALATPLDPRHGKQT
jgi:DNA-directed RNA polymerase specialized sigma24 family protein